MKSLGHQISTAIHQNLASGLPVLDRIDAFSEGFLIQWRSEIERSLKALPHQLLLPLYCLVLPAVMGFLGVCFYLFGGIQDAGI